MIPNGGYNFDQCNWKDEEKKKLLAILTPIRETFAKNKMENFWEVQDYSGLNNVPLSDLQEIISTWSKKAFELETINFKMAVTKEYKLILEFSKKCNEVFQYLQAEKEFMEDEVRTSYSAIVSQNHMFSEYFSYHDFKKVLNDMLDPDTTSIKKIQDLKRRNVFEIIRKKVIADKANLMKLIEKSGSNMIHLGEILKEDINTARLLGAEFFNALCSETMLNKIPYGKLAHTETIRPSHPKAKQLRIQRTELALFTMSMSKNGITDLAMPLGSIMEFNSGLKFEVVQTQQVIEKEMFYQLNLGSQTANILMPVYFSFIRFNLVREQRSSYNKIDSQTVD